MKQKTKKILSWGGKCNGTLITKQQLFGKITPYPELHMQFIKANFTNVYSIRLPLESFFKSDFPNTHTHIHRHT